VFGVEIEGCARCGGKLKIIASIEEPAAIAKILARREKAASKDSRPQLVPRAPRTLWQQGAVSNYSIWSSRFE
jgi:hypothetical protein